MCALAAAIRRLGGNSALLIFVVAHLTNHPFALDGEIAERFVDHRSKVKIVKLPCPAEQAVQGIGLGLGTLVAGAFFVPRCVTG